MNYEILIFSINTKNFYNQFPKELQTKFIKFPNQKKSVWPLHESLYRVIIR